MHNCITMQDTVHALLGSLYLGHRFLFCSCFALGLVDMPCRAVPCHGVSCRWCGPCQMMSEILTQVGPQMKDELKIVKVSLSFVFVRVFTLRFSGYGDGDYFPAKEWLRSRLKCPSGACIALRACKGDKDVEKACCGHQ